MLPGGGPLYILQCANGSDTWKLIGPAFMHGYMCGETLRDEDFERVLDATIFRAVASQSGIDFGLRGGILDTTRETKAGILQMFQSKFLTLVAPVCMTQEEDVAATVHEREEEVKGYHSWSDDRCQEVVRDKDHQRSFEIKIGFQRLAHDVLGPCR